MDAKIVSNIVYDDHIVLLVELLLVEGNQISVVALSLEPLLHVIEALAQLGHEFVLLADLHSIVGHDLLVLAYLLAQPALHVPPLLFAAQQLALKLLNPVLALQQDLVRFVQVCCQLHV